MKNLLLVIGLIFLFGCGGGGDTGININNNCSLERNSINNQNDCTITASDSEAKDEDNSVSNFLWKPVSESDGKLVVLTNPEDAEIDVLGDVSESLTLTGPSNGRGTTARGSFTGCDYGTNILVRITKKGKLLAEKTIADGCLRVEIP